MHKSCKWQKQLIALGDFLSAIICHRFTLFVLFSIYKFYTLLSISIAFIDSVVCELWEYKVYSEQTW